MPFYLDADLSQADLRLADLNEAKGVSNQELEQQAFSLEGAIMPNGQPYLREAAKQSQVDGSRPSEQRLLTVPDVASLPVEVARKTLEDSGLLMGDVEQEPSDTIPEGYIVSQSPQPGSLEPPDSPVNVTVSEGP